MPTVNTNGLSSHTTEGSLQILIGQDKMPSTVTIGTLRHIVSQFDRSANSPSLNNGFGHSPSGGSVSTGPNSPALPQQPAVTQHYQPIPYGVSTQQITYANSTQYVGSATAVATKSVTFATTPSPSITTRRSVAEAFGDRSLHIQSRSAPETLGPDDIPPMPAHPKDPAEIRALVRSKMIRCKECKSRFVEVHLYERHLAKVHPEFYEIYSEQQRKENESQRMFDLQENKREEILSGGFIPPMSHIDAALNYSDLDPTKIPLPGEETNGVLPRFDRYGGIIMPRRPYRRKVSPQCIVCDKRFRNEYSLKKHIAKKHPQWIDFIQCNRCFKAVRSVDDLPRHECDLDFICFECIPIRNMCTQERLDVHRCKFHRGPNSGFPCPNCKRRFLTPRKLRKHNIMYHPIKNPFKCHFCDEYFASEAKVGMHERIHTGKIRYECDICDYRSMRWPKLEKHKRIEHGYVCAICQEKTVEWSQLKMHTLDKHGGYLSNEAGAPVVDAPRVWVMYKGE